MQTTDHLLCETKNLEEQPSVRRASALGLCFGVRDALQLATLSAQSQPLSILGHLAHNPSILHHLNQLNIHSVSHPDQITTQTVMITAHGASQKTIHALQAKNLTTIEATCPLVHHAHQSLLSLVRQGYFPVIIGRRGHVEVNGLTGDLDAFAIVLSRQDIDQIPPHPKLGVISQTTQPIGRVRERVAQIKARFPHSEVRFVDTVCQPTKQRQTAAVTLSQESDVVIVIGGNNSNNTKELMQTCSRFCHRVHHVETAADLQREWFEQGDRVGITAGTSTPDSAVDSVEDRIRQWLRLPPMSSSLAIPSDNP